MRAQIHSIGTLIGDHLESVEVEDALHFSEMVRVLIGPESSEGEEIFDICVVSPQWIESECERVGYWKSLRTLVISRWDVELVKKAIRGTVEKVHGDSWDAVARQLAAFMFWEFQDYRERP